MQIYFENGPLKAMAFITKHDTFILNADCGPSANIKVLEELRKREMENGEEFVVYTNSIIAFSNEYAWNERLQVPEIYIRSGANNKFTRIDNLTNKELRRGHSLAKMYINEVFGPLYTLDLNTADLSDMYRCRNRNRKGD